MKVLTHQYSRVVGRSKDEKVISTPIALASDQVANAVAQAMNTANNGKGLYAKGSITVTELPVYNSAKQFTDEQEEKEKALQTEQADKAKKKLSKLTDAEIKALAATLGVDVSALKAAAKAEPKAEQTDDAEQTEAA